MSNKLTITIDIDEVMKDKALSPAGKAMLVGQWFKGAAEESVLSKCKNHEKETKRQRKRVAKRPGSHKDKRKDLADKRKKAEIQSNPESKIKCEKED